MGQLVDQRSGRSIVVAASHGVLRGPHAGLPTPDSIAAAFAQLGDADGIMVAPGMVADVEQHFVGRGRPGLVIEVDWKNTGRSVYNAPGANVVSASLATIEECAQAGAAGVMTFLYIGHDDVRLERDEIARNARLARECDRLGLACIIEPRAAQEQNDRAYANSAEVMQFYCRVAAEIGADLVKCVWPGQSEAFAAVTETCTAPVLLAGGPASDDDEGTFTLAHDAISAGAAGLMFGRRIYNGGRAGAVLAGLRAIVHDGASVEQALGVRDDSLVA
jgi:class I fructose-bisphosphate aldolase